jgi:hypothetical protein
LRRPRTARRTRFYSFAWIVVCLLPVWLGFITEFVVDMVGLASKPDGLGVAFFAVLTLPCLGLVAWMGSLMRPVTLTWSALRIPSGFRTVVIPVDDVGGVGLLYHGRGWLVFVWRRNGSVQRVGSLVCRRSADAPSGRIAASRAARMARRLDSKIRAVQGAAGSLATLELQKTAHVGLTSDLVAFWSPDGDMGPTRY